MVFFQLLLYQLNLVYIPSTHPCRTSSLHQARGVAAWSQAALAARPCSLGLSPAEGVAEDPAGSAATEEAGVRGLVASCACCSAMQPGRLPPLIIILCSLFIIKTSSCIHQKQTPCCVDTRWFPARFSIQHISSTVHVPL